MVNIFSIVINCDHINDRLMSSFAKSLRVPTYSGVLFKDGKQRIAKREKTSELLIVRVYESFMMIF